MASIEQRGEQWRAVWRMNGQKQRTLFYPDRADAVQADAIVRGKLNLITGPEVDRIVLGIPDQPTTSVSPKVAAWIETHLESTTTISPGMKDTYEMYARLHINPHLGDLRLDQLDGPLIGRWINTLRAEGCAETSITRYFSLLYGSCTSAMKVRPPLLTENPCGLTDFVRNSVAHDDDGNNENAVYLTRAEFALLHAAFPVKWRPMLDLMVDAGLRWSELTALQIGDLVQRKGGAWVVKVRRAWKRGTHPDPKLAGIKKGHYLGTPKGRRKRELVVADGIVEGLRPLMLDPAGRLRRPTTFLLTDGAGNPLGYHSWLRSVWNSSVVAASRCVVHPPALRDEPRSPELLGQNLRCGDLGGVTDPGRRCTAWALRDRTRCKAHAGPAVDAVSSCDCANVLKVSPTPHDCRHTMAAWLLGAGVQPVVVQRRLGHQKLETTTEIYGGLIPEDVDHTVLDALWRQPVEAVVDVPIAGVAGEVAGGVVLPFIARRSDSRSQTGPQDREGPAAEVR